MRVLKFIMGIWLFALFCASAPAATVTVNMLNNQFSPRNVTINVGDTVTWVNLDPRGHDTVGGSGGVPNGTWNSTSQYGRLMVRNESFSHTFTSAGVFPYYCTPHWLVFNMTGTITVQAVNAAPSVSITSPGNGADFSAPANITLHASASDSDGSVASVEFFLNGESVGAAINPPYETAANNLGAGQYVITAKATDDSGASSFSAPVTITVSGLVPVITSAPQSQIVNVGNDVVFSVDATGSAPLRYQWSFNQEAIAGATTASLLLGSVTEDQSGEYTVVVENDFGSTLATATLLVTNAPPGQPPTITSHPESVSVDQGTNVTFSINAIGSSPLFVQWFFGAEPIVNATNNVLELTNVTTNNAGTYFAVATNAFGSATSSNAVLTVIVPPTCSFELGTNHASFGAIGGIGAITVTDIAGAQCPWSVVNTNTWIQILSGFSSTGSGTVTYRVLSNTVFTARSGVLLVAGLPFEITQAASVFEAKSDFNKDGYTDLLWQHTDRRVALWLMNGRNLSSSLLLQGGKPANAGWNIVGVADFTGDNKVDILWQQLDGSLAIWVMDGSKMIRSELFSSGPALGVKWRVVGLADFNHDKKADLVFRHSEGYVLVRFMNGKKFFGQTMLLDGDPVPSDWKMAMISDLTRDAYTDILWRQQGTGTFVLWKMADTLVTAGTRVTKLPSPPAGGQVAGFADINRNGRTDMLWRHSDGHLSVWFMNGTTYVSGAPINNGRPVASGWKLVSPK